MSLLVLILVVAALFIWRPWESRDVRDVKVTGPMYDGRRNDDIELGDDLTMPMVPLVTSPDMEFGSEWIDVDAEKRSGDQPKWLDNGVAVCNANAGNQGELTIRYAGILRNDGADGVLLHHGTDGWNDTRDDWMKMDSDGTFSITLKADNANEVNFCFKDTADHFDDNNSWNWSVKVR